MNKYMIPESMLFQILASITALLNVKSSVWTGTIYVDKLAVCPIFQINLKAVDQQPV